MNPKSNRDRGKRCEAAIARELNGTRKGIMGGHDVESGPFAVEVKSRNAFAGSAFMEQAVKNCPMERYRSSSSISQGSATVGIWS